jgi:UDP-N-acetylglucosamine 2-epimerase (non-hydrolysing)
MSQVFFEHLGMPSADEYLNVGSGSHAVQTAQIMSAFEPVLVKHRPDWVIVVGDVNSTLACALVCAKAGVKIAHVEAGLRSGDRTMPEEINRLVTDRLSDLLLTPSPDADANLLREGVPREQVRFVGNIMVDSLVRVLPLVKERSTLQDHQVECGKYALATLHRPANVDAPEVLRELIQAMVDLAARMPVLFSLHPRTQARIRDLQIRTNGNLRFLEPLGYLDFICLMGHAAVVLTDSGGVQEETTFLGVPCLTIRPNTERPITVSEGTNRLVPAEAAVIYRNALAAAVSASPRKPAPAYWDGKTSERIVKCLLDL